MSWYEFHLKPDADLAAFYEELDDWSVAILRWHHFWDEPWNPKGYVVRVETEVWEDIDTRQAHKVIEWDAGPDETLYGDKFDAAMAFFQSASILNPNGWEQGKFVHCFLNAQGMSWFEEARWHFRQGWKRLILPFKLSRFSKFGRAHKAQMERDAVDRRAREIIRQAA